MSKDEFKAIIAVLRSNYKGFIVDMREKFDFWYEALADLDYNICQKAIMQIIMQEEFAPTIAKIRRVCLELQGQKSLSVIDAMQLITKAASYGRYRSVEAMNWLKEQDECAYNVMKAIGYTNYCNADPNYTRGTVLKMYTEAAMNKENQLLLSQTFAQDIMNIQLNGFMLTESD